MKHFRRIILTLIFIVLFFLVQNHLFLTNHLLNTSPNLLLLFTVTMAFLRGKNSGIFVGAACGFLCDIFYGDIFGFYTLVYIYIGFLNGIFHKFFFGEEIILPLVLCGLSDLLYGFIIYFFYYMLNGKFNAGYYMLNIALPEMLFTVILMVILYRPLLWLNGKLEAVEKRSEKKFV